MQGVASLLAARTVETTGPRTSVMRKGSIDTPRLADRACRPAESTLNHFLFLVDQERRAERGGPLGRSGATRPPMRPWRTSTTTTEATGVVAPRTCRDGRPIVWT